MGEWFRNLVEQIQVLPRQRQLLLAGAAVGSLAFFAYISLSVGTPSYKTLYRGLEVEEARRMVDALRAERIDYQLADGATTIRVPVDQIHEARIRVAGQGLGGGNGFELFDRPAFGVTDFVHRVNYSRAVQGELARSIEQLEPVERARVQVVIPERGNVLAASRRKASASVVVRLVPGRELVHEQARAITNLVASSIEGLEPSEVTVVDNAGRLLAPLGDEKGPGALAPSGAREHQARLENDLAERIEAILEPVVGMGGVVARVNAEMDWTESEVTEERFDPDSQVARSESLTDEFEALGSDGGAPGIAANAPGLESAGAEPGPSGSTRKVETINYEISKKVSHSVTATGVIQRLSVAVLVDAGRAAPVAPGEGEAAGEGEATPAEGWSAEELQRFEQLARQAVGLSDERGDRIVVTSSAFQIPDMIGEEGFALDPGLLGFGFEALRIVAQLGALLLFILLVAKPVIGSIATSEPALAGASLPASVSSLEAQLQAGGEQGELGEGGEAARAGELAAPEVPLSLAEQVGLEAGSRSEDSVSTIRNWLNQD